MIIRIKSDRIINSITIVEFDDSSVIKVKEK